MTILYGQPFQPPKKSIASLLLKVIFDKGIESAIMIYHDLKTNHPQSYDFEEKELNMLGYELLHQDKMESAIKIFRLNADVYPNAWNVYDSLGEAYLRNNQKNLAIEYYNKSLVLNPNNKNAKQVLKRLNEE
jgi:tetratricopeptide (TPR) repeat protein